jgi:endonuclease-3 related protein
MVGAVLTQNTSWRNAERALSNLRAAQVLTPAKIHALPQEKLEQLLRPAGYFRVKARRLRALVDYLHQRHGDDLASLAHGDLETLRRELMSVHGVGPETADSILLYAAGRPTFVVDAYTERIFSRLGLAQNGVAYEELRTLFMDSLPSDPALFNEYHALIVRHAKERCHKREPVCAGCPLFPMCAQGQSAGRIRWTS